MLQTAGPFLLQPAGFCALPHAAVPLPKRNLSSVLNIPFIYILKSRRTDHEYFLVLQTKLFTLMTVPLMPFPQITKYKIYVNF